MPKRRKDEPNPTSIHPANDPEARAGSARGERGPSLRILNTGGRWVSTFERLFELFAFAMLWSEEKRALAVFALTPEGGPFAQFQMEPSGLMLDLPTTSVDGEARERLLAAGLGLARAAEIPELRPSDADIRDFDPLRKDYDWQDGESAARDLAFLLFDFFGAPRTGPIFLTWWAEGGLSVQRTILIGPAAPKESVH